MSEAGLITPWSAHLTVEETVRRIRADERVIAISFLGSTGTEASTAASDVDLCVLLRDYPAKVGVEVTFVDERIADIVVIDADWAASMCESGPDEEGLSAYEWPYLQWLAQSRPVFDPAGLAAAARDRARRAAWAEVQVSPEWQQTTRSFVTHDVRVNTALLRRVDDPIVRVALGMRQLHTFVSVVQAWFTARDLHHEGWKQDITRIATSDPTFHGLIEQWLGTSDVTTRHEIFVAAVAHALSPIGGPLSPGTVVSRSDDVWEGLNPAIHRGQPPT